jgi:hypothetical protein
MNSRTVLRLTIYGLILLTFYLGLPQLHYSVAIMIALLIRHKDNPQGLFQPVKSTALMLPWQKSSSESLLTPENLL